MWATTTFLSVRKAETNAQLLGAFFFIVVQQYPVGQNFLVHKVSRSHTDTPQSVGLPWTSD